MYRNNAKAYISSPVAELNTDPAFGSVSEQQR